MSHIKITAPPGASAHGTQIEVDGHVLQDVVDISLRFPVDDVVRCDVGLFVSGPFEYVGPGEVHLHFHLQEGTRMVETTTQDDPPGSTKFTIVKATE